MRPDRTSESDTPPTDGQGGPAVIRAGDGGQGNGGNVVIVGNIITGGGNVGANRIDALQQFVAICSMSDKSPAGYDEARRRCADLYAILGGDKRASYIATVAFVWFCDKEKSYRINRFTEALDEVAEHLRAPQVPWTAPSSGPIHDWAREVSPENRALVRLWLLNDSGAPERLDLAAPAGPLVFRSKTVAANTREAIGPLMEHVNQVVAAFAGDPKTIEERCSHVLPWLLNTIEDTAGRYSEDFRTSLLEFHGDASRSSAEPLTIDDDAERQRRQYRVRTQRDMLSEAAQRELAAALSSPPPLSLVLGHHQEQETMFFVATVKNETEG